MTGNLSLWPEAASTMAGEVDALYIFLIAVSAFFSILVATLVIVFAIRFHRQSEDEKPPQIHGSLVLELTWTIIPLGLVMVMFFWGASVYANFYRPPDDAMQVYVVGKQWMWKAQHLEGRREINELHVPVGRPVKVTMTSEDVIHSFFIPAFRVKQDAVPGRYSTLWFEASKAGTYHLFCAEYCGTEHSQMIGSIVAMDPADYQAWLAGSSGGSMVSQGEKLFHSLGCATCHAGVAGARGPALADLPGSRVQLTGGGSALADDRYLRESILNPAGQIVAGYQPIMPTFKGLVSEEGLLQLIAYIKTLKTSETNGPLGAPGVRPASAQGGGGAAAPAVAHE